MNEWLLVLLLESIVFCIHGLLPEMYPASDPYLIVGDTLKLSCIVKDKNLSANESLRIHCPRKECSSWQYNVTEDGKKASLVIVNVTDKDSGSYVCTWNNSDKYANYRKVTIGYSPKRPDVFCYSLNWMNMTCTITLVPSDVSNPLPVHWSLNFSTDGGDHMSHCNNSGSGICVCKNLKKGSAICEWQSSYNYPRYNRNSFSTLADYYNISVTLSNKAKTNDFFYTVKPQRIVKPSKVESLHIESISSKAANISWALPEDLIPLFKMKYKIMFKSKWDKRFQQIHFIRKERYIATMLTDLVPFSSYTVTVRCKPVKSLGKRYWSDPSSLNFTTDGDVPAMAPESVAGGYYIPFPESGPALIFLYLKPIPRIFLNGENVIYKILLVNPKRTRGNVEFNRSYPTITAQLNVPAIDHIDFTITACNHIGCFKGEPSHLSTAPLLLSGTDYPFAQEVIVESYELGKFRLSWEVSEEKKANVTSHTCLWCRGDSNDRVCRSDISWQSLHSPLNTSLNIEVQTSQNQHWPFMFGVALINKDGRSSGLAFADCIFINHGERKDPEKPTFNLLLDKNTNTRMIVSLAFTFCDSHFLKSKPEDYRVFYKMISENYDNRSCTEGAKIKTVKATVSLREITIGKLNPGSRYSVCMTVVTVHGTSQPSEAQYQQLGKSTNKGGMSESIIGVISISLGSVLMTTIFMCFCRWIYSKWQSLDDAIEEVHIPLSSEKHTTGHSTASETTSSYCDRDSSGTHGRQSPVVNIFTDSTETFLPNENTLTEEEVASPFLQVSSAYSKICTEVNNYVKTTTLESQYLKTDNNKSSTAGYVHEANLICASSSFVMKGQMSSRLQDVDEHVTTESSDDNDISDGSINETNYSSMYGLNSLSSKSFESDSLSSDSHKGLYVGK